MSDLIFNERTKLLANNFDRASTAAVVAGLFAPFASQANGLVVTPLQLLSTVIWLLTAVALHWGARLVLGRLRS